MSLFCHLHSTYGFNWNKAPPTPPGGVRTKMTTLKRWLVSWWRGKLLFHVQLLVLNQLIRVKLESSFFWNITIHHLVFVTQQFETIWWLWGETSPLLRSWVRIPRGAWIFVCCECRVLSGRGLCDELITRPEESYRLWCVVVCDLETSRMGAPYIYDISRLRVKAYEFYRILMKEYLLQSNFIMFWNWQ